MNQCRYYGKCNAPLCPLDPDLNSRLWYPDEEVCRSRKLTQGLKWVENQKKIAKKAKSNDLYYNVTMLDRDMIIRSGIDGLNPDSRTPEDDLKKWLKAHPERNLEQKEQLRLNAKKGFKNSRVLEEAG